MFAQAQGRGACGTHRAPTVMAASGSGAAADRVVPGPKGAAALRHGLQVADDPARYVADLQAAHAVPQVPMLRPALRLLDVLGAPRGSVLREVLGQLKQKRVRGAAGASPK